MAPGGSGAWWGVCVCVGAEVPVACLQRGFCPAVLEGDPHR